MFGAADGVQICFRVGQRAPGTALERREGARVRHEQPVVGEPFETHAAVAAAMGACCCGRAWRLRRSLGPNRQDICM